jgi:hypothetical protein
MGADTGMRIGDETLLRRTNVRLATVVTCELAAGFVARAAGRGGAWHTQYTVRRAVIVIAPRVTFSRDFIGRGPETVTQTPGNGRYNAGQ